MSETRPENPRATKRGRIHPPSASPQEESGFITSVKKHTSTRPNPNVPVPESSSHDFHASSFPQHSENPSLPVSPTEDLPAHSEELPSQSPLRLRPETARITVSLCADERLPSRFEEEEPDLPAAEAAEPGDGERDIRYSSVRVSAKLSRSSELYVTGCEPDTAPADDDVADVPDVVESSQRTQTHVHTHAPLLSLSLAQTQTQTHTHTPLL